MSISVLVGSMIIAAVFRDDAANPDCLHPPAAFLYLSLGLAIFGLLWSFLHFRWLRVVGNLGSLYLETFGILIMALPYLMVSILLGMYIVLIIIVDHSSSTQNALSVSTPGNTYRSHLVWQVVLLSIALNALLGLFIAGHWTVFNKQNESYYTGTNKDRPWLSFIVTTIVFSLSYVSLGFYASVLYHSDNYDKQANAIYTAEVVLFIFVIIGKLFTWLYFAYFRKLWFHYPILQTIATTIMAAPYLLASVLLGMSIGLWLALDHSGTITSQLTEPSSGEATTTDDYLAYARWKTTHMATTVLLLLLPFTVGHYWSVRKRIRIEKENATFQTKGIEPTDFPSTVRSSTVPSTVACAHSVERQRLLSSCPHFG